MGAAAGDDVGARLVFADAGTVRCQNKRGQVYVALEGMLDQATALALVDAVVRAVSKQPKRIVIDLRLVTSFADDGAKALARCRELCSQLPGGLHFRTDDGPGQLALLGAFDSEPLTEVE